MSSNESLPFLTREGLSRVRLALEEAENSAEFFREVDLLLEDHRLVIAGDTKSWPHLERRADGDGANSVAVWRHTLDHPFLKENFGLSQATDGRFWTFMALSRYRDYMLARWDPEDPGIKDWRNRIRNRWLMPMDPRHKNGLLHGIARLWWIACLSHADKPGSQDLKLTRWILEVERRPIDLLDRYVVMSEPTRYSVLELVHAFPEMTSKQHRALLKELNNVAGVRDLDSMSEHARKSLIEEIAQRI